MKERGNKLLKILDKYAGIPLIALSLLGELRRWGLAWSDVEDLLAGLDFAQ